MSQKHANFLKSIISPPFGFKVEYWYLKFVDLFYLVQFKNFASFKKAPVDSFLLKLQAHPNAFSASNQFCQVRIDIYFAGFQWWQDYSPQLYYVTLWFFKFLNYQSGLFANQPLRSLKNFHFLTIFAQVWFDFSGLLKLTFQNWFVAALFMTQALLDLIGDYQFFPFTVVQLINIYWHQFAQTPT